MALDESGLPAEVRFWSRVDKTDGCWIWTGAPSGGYGRLRVGSLRVQAHRYSLELHAGQPVPDEMHVDHLCRNKLCVRPEHLEPVSPQENTRRGMAPSSVAKRTGVCVSGQHELSEGNSLLRANGKRQCKACTVSAQRAWVAANREKINAQKRARYARIKGGE